MPAYLSNHQLQQSRQHEHEHESRSREGRSKSGQNAYHWRQKTQEIAKVHAVLCNNQIQDSQEHGPWPREPTINQGKDIKTNKKTITNSTNGKKLHNYQHLAWIPKSRLSIFSRKSVDRIFNSCTGISKAAVGRIDTHGPSTRTAFRAEVHLLLLSLFLPIITSSRQNVSRCKSYIT